MSTKLFHFIIEMPKDETYFAYFTLEAADGIGFYSTLDHKEGDQLRQMSIKGDYALIEEMRTIIHGLMKNHQLKIIKEEVLTL